MASIVSAYLLATQSSLLDVCWQPSLLRQASCLKTIRALYDAAVALFPVLNYLTRLGGPTKDSSRCIADLVTFADSVIPMLPLAEGADLLYLQRFDAMHNASPFPAVRDFATTELKHALDKKWTYVNGTYFVSRGTSRKEVNVDVGLIEEETRDLKRSLEVFLREVPLVHRFAGEGDTFTAKDGVDAWNGMEDEKDLLLF